MFRNGENRQRNKYLSILKHDRQTGDQVNYILDVLFCRLSKIAAFFPRYVTAGRTDNVNY